ncbi:MAG: DMT family transporter [Salaquimonas sp.]
MRNPSDTLLAFAGLIFFGLAWGTTQPLTKIAVSTGHLPLGLIFWQLVFAVLLIGIVLWARKIPVPFNKQHLFYYVGVSILGTLVPNSFSYLAAAQLPAGIMAVVITTVPMFSLMIALSVGNEKFRMHRSLGIILGVSAMLMIALPEASLPTAGQGFWLLIALIAPFCYGIEGNFVASKAPPKLNPMAALWGASFFGMLISGPAAIVSGQWVDLFIPWQAAEWAILGSSIGHAIAYSGYMWLVGFAGVVFTAQISYVVMICAISISMLFLGEAYSSWVWLAIGLILIGLTLVQPIGKLPDPEVGDIPNP